MKNLNNIKYLIQFEEFYNILPNLKLLSGNNKFNRFLLSNNNNTLNIVYVGSLNNFNFFFPLDINELATYVITNNNIKFNYKNLDFALLNNTLIIYMSTLIISFGNNDNNIINLNCKLSDKEKSMFTYNLDGIENMDFKKISEECYLIYNSETLIINNPVTNFKIF